MYALIVRDEKINAGFKIFQKFDQRPNDRLDNVIVTPVFNFISVKSFADNEKVIIPMLFSKLEYVEKEAVRMAKIILENTGESVLLEPIHINELSALVQNWT